MFKLLFSTSKKKFSRIKMGIEQKGEMNCLKVQRTTEEMTATFCSFTAAKKFLAQTFVALNET